MSDVVIKVENLSKQYRLGEVGTGTISHDLNRWWAKLRGKDDPFLRIGESNDRTTKGESDYIWALQDINFEVKQGEVLGIIGRNGAGKSTLLKILSKTTTPTTGNVKVKGRIASLLEVGTGFHPEMTGRENIFLNGAILGMTRKEIKNKFDEIVDFAGVERYIDTPVKRYSSGMYVRLAFAVAAHLEPEILIIDEVLAVGDAEFQKKCLGKMKDVSVNDGRTVLFVSHNMAAVKAMCSIGIVLRNGLLQYFSNSHNAVNYYQNTGELQTHFLHKGNLYDAPGNNNVRILEFKIIPIDGGVLSLSSGVNFNLRFLCNLERINLDVTFELQTIDDIVVFHNGQLITKGRDSERCIYEVEFTIQPYVLNSGIYKFKMIFGQDQSISLFTIDNFIQFEILNEMKGSNANQLPGVVFLPLNFEVRKHKTVLYG